MAVSLLLAMQAAAPAVEPVGFDLGALDRRRSEECGAARGDEILVCGRLDDPRYRLPNVQEAERSLALPRAEIQLGNGATVRAQLDAVPMDRGAVSNRIMIGFGLRF